MLVDSHCHLNMLDLTEFKQDLQPILDAARNHDVGHFLSVCVELTDLPQLQAIAEQYPQVSISVGIHPDSDFLSNEPDADALVALTAHPACIAIGETGLDYYRTETEIAREKQRERFRAHIQAAKTSGKPLIIHTRQAAEDTITIMREENAADIGGVMHCFTEDWSVAQRALDLNFYISFSGIVTFKNALIIQDVAKKVPLDRILIETDAPFLAPVPFRGQQNQPAWVKIVAETVAQLRQIDYETIAFNTTTNFYRCFKLDRS